MKRSRSVPGFLLHLPVSAMKRIAAGYGVLARTVSRDDGDRLDRTAKEISALTRTVSHNTGGKNVKMTFFTPNAMCRYRAESFSRKEPDTLRWIDENGDGGAFFDIGANVGVYSIYFGVTKPGNVYSFEPSVFNLSVIAKNISANGLESRVRLIANPLSSESQFAHFRLSNPEEGGAISAFGVDYGYDGKKLETSFAYQTLGFSLDFMFEHGLLTEYPKMIKIDVDGIEHLILAGAEKTLRNPVCRTVLIEVSNAFQEQSAEVTRLMLGAGFVLDAAAREAALRTRAHADTYNQIWIKA